MSCIKTTCAYCGVGCGVEASVTGDYAASVKGDEQHPANFGKLCSKGSALGETVDLEGRLLQPMVHGQATSWDLALDAVAHGFSRAVEQYGPDRVAFYVSGQLLTEDYYVANKLMKGYIGGANIDTNSRLCMSSAVAGHKRAFGADIVPGCYDDLELADLVVLTGSNTAWCHPIVFQRILKSKQQNPNKKIICIDPRRTATAEQSDLHLAVKPGTDVLLFNGLLAFLYQHKKLNESYIKNHTEAFDNSINNALNEASSIEEVAKHCELAAADVKSFYQQFADNDKTVTVFSQGVNQSSSGTDKVNAIINCHLATGRVGKPGASPFSITGQPNAMGGREVGGLANMLAAHMGFENPQHPRLVQEFWQSPKIAKQNGFKAVEMFDAIHDGYIKAVWVMATNPAVSLPNAGKVNEALEKCEFVAVSDCIANTDTARYADVLLPATGWGEKDGTVTNSDRHISRQRAFLPPAGDARPDWQIICDVAKRMGYGYGFPYESQREIFNEHAGLSGYKNNGSRDFDISAFESLTAQQYDDLAPVQWPISADTEDGNHTGTKRMLGDGKFYTASGKAQFVAVSQTAPKNSVSEQYPLVLNSGRIRDHWHTMTRTGKSARLSGHIAESFVAIHLQDAEKYNVQDAQIARLNSAWGESFARVEVSDAQRPGEIFTPIHWTDQFAANSVIGKLVNPEVDAISGEPEFKHTPVSIMPLPVKWYGFVLTRQQIPLEQVSAQSNYWTKVTGTEFSRYEMASGEHIRSPEAWAKHLFGIDVVDQQEVSEEGVPLAFSSQSGSDSDWIDYIDLNTGLYRAAWLVNNKLEACVFLSPKPELPSRSWLASLFAADEITQQDRTSLLLGESPDPDADVGPIVCACFAVGKNVINKAIVEKGLQSTGEIGECLKAGTNCGSCVPELAAMLEAKKVSTAA